MKKLVTALLACALLALAGCAASPASSESESADKLEAHDKAASAESAEASAEAASEEASATEEPAAPATDVLLSDFAALSQYPELPNGCEVTTLAAVLAYEGVPVDKGYLSDTFLPKAPVGQANFYREFVGDPRNSDAYGCYAPVLEATARAYLASVNSPLTVTDLTGTPLDALFPYVERGIPVILWATQYNQTGHYSVTWYVDGEALTWFTPEHCMALVGYDTVAGLVYVADPMQGAVVSFDLDAFRANYNDLGQQAFIIS